MKFSLKAVALSALLAATVSAAPIEVEKRDANSDRIAACFVGLIFTGAWPGSCQAAVAVSLGLIKSIAVNQMTMDFTPADPWKPTTSSNNIVATMLSIPGINLPIDSIRQHIILADGATQIGNIDTPWCAANVKNGALTTAFPTSTLNVFSTSHTAFSNFIASLSTKTSHDVTLQGAVDAKLNLGIFGHLTIPGIGFKVTTPFVGLNNLSNIKYIYLVDTSFDTPGVLAMTTIINIINPSKLTLKLGDVSFDTAYTTGHVGYSVVKNLVLVPGDNYVLSTTNLNAELPATNDFLTGLYEGDAPLALTGYSGTSADVALNAGLATIQSKLVIPVAFTGSVMSQNPYKNLKLKVLPTTAQDGLVEISGTFQSPYYGYSVQMTSDNGAGNYATTTAPVGQRLFKFADTLRFTAPGTGSANASFKVPINGGPISPSVRGDWEQLVAYGAANGYIPITIYLICTVVVNNDGIPRQVDWSSASTLNEVVNIAVGPDFANILDYIPA